MARCSNSIRDPERGVPLRVACQLKREHGGMHRNEDETHVISWEDGGERIVVQPKNLPAFPAEADLAVDEHFAMGAIITPQVTSQTQLAKALNNVREAYARKSGKSRSDCDIVLLALPRGRGQAFAEGLAQAKNMKPA